MVGSVKNHQLNKSKFIGVITYALWKTNVEPKKRRLMEDDFPFLSGVKISGSTLVLRGVTPFITYNDRRGLPCEADYLEDTQLSFTLPKTTPRKFNSSPLKVGKLPKGNSSSSPIIFQGRALKFRGCNIKSPWKLIILGDDEFPCRSFAPLFRGLWW